MTNYKADLHLHTNYSDGVLSPSKLIDLAKKNDLSVISITDHDNVNGIEEAIEYGNSVGIQVIPGVEISADIDDNEIHILGYFIDHKNPEFLDFLKNSRQMRIERNEKIVNKLNDLGSKINFDDILKKVGSQTSLGRPHIAMELYDEGFVKTYYEAFFKYIGDDKTAYVRKSNPDAKEVIEMISKCKGLSFIAHPGKYIRDEKLLKLTEHGLDGIEVVHPSHDKESMAYFNKIISEKFLLSSGGSDFHGGIKNDSSCLGKFCISGTEIQNMKRRLFI
ncbi:MAG TPA: PHP domain-containing protein [Ignavibacteria bacterium]|nr:PHP domain-containing protein [Ignavibacteria bacterium]HRA99384.1 PHP domain-containing protein [Ignavibacteria bacterium]